MAKLGIIKKFEASHGSRKIRIDKFIIEIEIEGALENGFVAGVDYIDPQEKLDCIVNELAGKYLDNILGRATDENIAQYFLYHLKGLPIKSVKVHEGEGFYVQIFAEEFNFEMYPAQLFYNLGHSFLLRENPEKAKEYFTKAIALNNNFAEAYNLRGRCFKYLNDYESSLKDFLKAIEINPNLGEAWRNLGNAYLYFKKFDEMIQAFNKSIALMPNSALAINNRGYAYFIMGKSELSLIDHEKAIVIDPNYAEAHYDKGMALKKLGKENEAEKAFLESKKLKETGKNTYQTITMY